MRAPFVETRSPARRRLLGIALALTALAITPVAAAAATHAGHSARSATAASTKTLTYHGLRVDVPFSWPVYRTRPGSTRCVRFDVHAVYLGPQSATPDCPAKLVGRTDAVHIEPLDAATAERLRITERSAAVADRSNPTAHEYVRAYRAFGTVVTVTYDASARTARRILDSIRPASDATASTPRLPLRLDSLLPQRSGSVVYTGEGFDACTAPSSTTMNKWLSSPYRSIGVYIGGISRACSQPNLTSSWVRTVTGAGWKLVPTYVGLQAPCTGFSHRIDASKAASQGRAAADDAVSQAAALGMGRGTPIYFDMEAYDSSNGSCVSAVRTFISAWVGQLHAKHYTAGMYSSVASGIQDQADVYNDPRYERLDAIWFAHWDGRHAVYGDPYISDSVWDRHRRLHQYRGGHNETWGGVTINIDSDYDDGPVFGG